VLVIKANVKLQTKKNRRTKDVPPHLYLKIMANAAAAKSPHHSTAIQLGYEYAGGCGEGDGPDSNGAYHC
jgi:hypothetical protein